VDLGCCCCLTFLSFLLAVEIRDEGITYPAHDPVVCGDLIAAARLPGSASGWSRVHWQEAPRGALGQLTATVIAVFGHLQHPDEDRINLQTLSLVPAVRVPQQQSLWVYVLPRFMERASTQIAITAMTIPRTTSPICLVLLRV